MAGATSERKKVRQLVERSGVALLMTLDDRGAPVGRPMLPLLLDRDPHLYFLTHQRSRKVAEISARPDVALAITASDSYVLISGRADVLHDAALLDKLWHPTYRAWFPEGKDDRDTTILRISVQRVDYWEPPRTRLARIGEAIKAVLTRTAIETPMKTIDGL